MLQGLSIKDISPLDLLYSNMANHAFELSLEHLSIKMIELHLKHHQQRLRSLHQMHDIPKLQYKY